MNRPRDSVWFGLAACLLLAGIGVSYALMANGEETGDDLAVFANPPPGSAVATFAGGCFWCMEPPYDRLPGVHATISGYIGGETTSPSYQQVISGRTGHAEAVQVIYDPDQISYAELLEVFWRNIDPLVENRQFCDVGSQYRTAIFYHDDAQRQAAEASAIRVRERFSDQTVYTQIVPAGTFYAAEDYHQDYYIKSSSRYKYYRWACGRDRRLEELWGSSG